MADIDTTSTEGNATIPESLSWFSVFAVALTTFMAVPFFLFFSNLFIITLRGDVFLGDSSYSSTFGDRVEVSLAAFLVVPLSIALPIMASRLFLPRRVRLWVPLSVILIWMGILVSMFLSA